MLAKIVKTVDTCNSFANKHKKICSLLFYGIFLLVMFLFAGIEPLWETDDLYVASVSPKFSVAFNFCLVCGNGRMIGNMISIWLGNFTILRVIVKTVVPVVVFAMICDVVGIKNILAKVFLVALICVTLPYDMLRQTLSWTMGFCIYTLPLLFFLIIIRTIKKTAEPKAFSYLLVAILGFGAQFFCEHYMMFAIFFALVFMLRAKKKGDRRLGLLLTWFVSGIVGAFFVDIIPLLYTVGDGQATYRSSDITLDLLCQRYFTFVITPQNVLLIFVVAAMFLRGGWKSLDDITKWQKMYMGVALLAIVIGVVYSVMTALDMAPYAMILYVPVTIFYLLLTAQMITSLYKHFGDGRIHLLWILSMCSSPGIFIKIFGDRAFMMSFVMMCVLCVVLLGHIVRMLKASPLSTDVPTPQDNP